MQSGAAVRAIGRLLPPSIRPGCPPPWLSPWAVAVEGVRRHHRYLSLDRKLEAGARSASAVTPTTMAMMMARKHLPTAAAGPGRVGHLHSADGSEGKG